MFRTTTRTSGGQAPVKPLNRISQSSGDLPESSHWKPALRRIGKGLFSSRDTTKGSDRQQQAQPSIGPHYPVNEHAILAKRYSQPVVVQVQDVETRQPPKGPRDPQNSNGFGFLKRTFSKSKKQVVSSPDDDSTPVIAQVTQTQSNGGGSQRQSTLKTVPKAHTNAVPNFSRPSVEPRRLSHTFEERPRPTTAYVPRHAATDFTYGTIQRKPLPHARDREAAVRPSTAYVPKHAASDFSQMKLVPQIDPCNPLICQFTQYASLIEPIPDSNDYQNFLAASPRAAAQRDNKNSAPQVTRIMDEITANHHAKTNERAMSISISQRTAVSRPGSRGGPPSIIEKVGEYIKPTKPESVCSQSLAYPFFDDDRRSGRGSTHGEQRGAQDRWSMVSGSIRRSFSRSREEDEKMRNSWNGDGVQNRKPRIMPISLGLKKYNKAIGRSY